ncbi:MAG: NAD(P)/FAD-dependent oxidoreductase [Cytophagaceae bacterium]|nr:NAD(P)/FAD-dependent oxidoreductase [Cytophagaceae bacterium]
MKKPAPHLVVVGGGAAGFFAAITAAESFPDARITILEKNRTLLNKVRISGGGRCNVTNAVPSLSQLVQGYPRGGKFLRPLVKQFSNADTVRWFEDRGVPLKTEPDGRIFPVSDDSADVVQCLIDTARRQRVEIRTSINIQSIDCQPDKFSVRLAPDELILADQLLIASGGHPNASGYGWLAELGHTIVPPVPSLFTFNVPASPLLALAGVSTPKASVRVPGTRQTQEGPVLLTHWGFSGPAVLRLSAWAARELAACNYQFDVAFNWNAETNDQTVRQLLADYRRIHARKQVVSVPAPGLPQRLWRTLVLEAGVPETTRWADAPAKALNRLCELLVNGTFRVAGKTTFKEEFVTCGGIALSDVNPQTLESLHQPGLFFAGEVLDIDGITGGYNFQAAWTTGYIAGKNCFGKNSI